MADSYGSIWEKSNQEDQSSMTDSSSSIKARLACTKSRDIEHYVVDGTDFTENTSNTPEYYVDSETEPINSGSLIPTSLEDAVGEEKTCALRKEAKTMQDGLAAILERILKVKGEYERLEGENKFLQDYIGNLMSASKMLSGRTSE